EAISALGHCHLAQLIARRGGSASDNSLTSSAHSRDPCPPRGQRYRLPYYRDRDLVVAEGVMVYSLHYSLVLSHVKPFKFTAKRAEPKVRKIGTASAGSWVRRPSPFDLRPIERRRARASRPVR